jgi:REP element-mobilizing transposase RayT
MPRERVVTYLHLVWGTWNREPRIQSWLEPTLHNFIAAEAQGQGCTVLALNGVTDHVHLLVEVPSTIEIARLMQQLKGASSRALNRHYRLQPRFRWEGVYGAFSVSRWDVAMIKGYIEKQKHHHADRTTRPVYEAVGISDRAPTR